MGHWPPASDIGAVNKARDSQNPARGFEPELRSLSHLCSLPLPAASLISDYCSSRYNGELISTYL